MAAAAPVVLDISSIDGSANQAMNYVSGGTNAGQTSNWTFSYTIPSGNNQGILTGDYTLSVTASDNNTPIFTDTATMNDFTVNNIAPTITDALENSNNPLTITTLPTTITITADIIDQNGHNVSDDDLSNPGFVRAVIPAGLNSGSPNNATMYDDGATGGDTAAYDGKFTYTHTIPVGTLTGNYTITVRARDKSGTEDTFNIIIIVN